MLPIKISFNRVVSGSLVALMTFLTVSAEELEARYWFDFDSDNCHTCTFSSSDSQLLLPLNHLSNKAIHQLNFQIRHADGEWSTVYTQIFNSGCNSDLSLLYTFDGMYSKHSLDMTNPVCDVLALCDGLHHISILDGSGCMIPSNQFFYKNSAPEKNLMLAVSSTRNNMLKRLAVGRDNGTVTLDISDWMPGIYPVNINLSNASNYQTIAAASSLVNVTPLGGDGVAGIYYWLDDSIACKKKIAVNGGELPFTYSDNVDISDFDVTTSDYTMIISGEGPKITPNFNLGVSILTNNGFQADTTSYFVDSSRTQFIPAVTLKSGEQHDFGEVTSKDILWTKFPVQENDVIHFIPRWKSKAKFFDNNATPLDLVSFDYSNTGTTFKATSNGTCYAQLYDIDESIRDFAVKMTYVSGPSFEKPIDTPEEYEGVLIDWKSSAEWSCSDAELTLDKNDIRLDVLKMGATFMPEVAERTNLLKSYQSNKLVFSYGGYIDKITLCVPSECFIPEIEAAEGSVRIDRDANIVVWEGLSSEVCLTIKKYRSSDIYDNISMPELLLEKAYVKTSDIDESVYVSEANQVPDDFDYVGYNCMRIWENGKKVGEYLLNDEISMTFDKNLIRIMKNGIENIHEIREHLIITYSKEAHISGLEVIEISQPTVKIAGEVMEFSGLPNYVGIYALDGRVIFYRYVENPSFNYPLNDLIPGIYIVKVGNVTTKMLIK